MKKNAIKGYFVLVVIFVVFSVAAFVSPVKKNSVFWVAYVFGVIAIVSQIYFFKVAFLHGDIAKSKFYGFPIARIGTVYLIVQIIICTFEFFIASFVPAWPFAILNMIVTAFAAIGCISAEIARDEVEYQDRELKMNIFSMRNLQSLAINLLTKCHNNEINSDLSKLADAFKYSDPVSNEATLEHEKEIRELLIELQNAVSDENVESVKKLSIKVRAALIERNRICKLNK